MSDQQPSNDPAEDWRLLQGGHDGTVNGWETVMAQYRTQLRTMIELRIHPRLQGRVDASDVIQETFLEATRVLDSQQPNTEIPVFVWLRRLANQKLIQAHRHHLDAACREAGREQVLSAELTANSHSIARYLVGNFTSPSNVAIRIEREQLLQLGLEQMDPMDREVLVLRHFERMSGAESATILGISHEAVKKRYVRALEKLQRIMAQHGVAD